MTDKRIKKQKEKLEAQTAISSSSINSAVEALNLLGIEFLYEAEGSGRIVAALTDVIYMPQHWFLTVSQTDHYFIDANYYNFSAYAKNRDVSADVISGIETKFYTTDEAIASALEKGIIEQYAPTSTDPVSTISLLRTANTNHQKIYALTPANFPTIGATAIAGYPTTPANDQAYITTLVTDPNYQYTLILPDALVTQGSWSWLGFIAKKYYFDSDGIPQYALGFMIMKGNEGSSTTVGQINPSSVDQNTPDEYVPPAKGTVNMIDGSYNYKHTSLQLGGGKTGLSFTHTYDSSNKNVTGTMGRGGSHNYDIRLKEMSMPMLMLGKRQPIDAAPVIAAIYAGLDLITNVAAMDNAEPWVDMAMVSGWLSDQIIGNTIILQKGNDTLEYVRMPDSTFVSPPGDTTTLTVTQNYPYVYTLTERFGTKITFNNIGVANVNQITDIDNNATNFLYNADNTLSSVSNNFGRSLGFAYNSGKISSVSDSSGRTIYYSYDASGNLNQYTDPKSQNWLYGYDSSNRMTTLTTPAVTGFTSGITMATNTYDSFDRVTNETVPIQGTNATATYNYYYSDYRNAAADPQGNSVAHYYDDNMREIATEDPLGNKTTKTYDGQNHVITVTDPQANVTTYQYDGNNNLTKTTNTLGYWVTNTYDTQFRLTDITDYLGHNSHFTYDTNHHLLSAQDALGNTASATYLTNGLKGTTTDANGTKNTITYDSYGNIKTTAAGSHPTITYNYNSANNYDIRGIRSGLADQYGYTTSFTFNNVGQLMTKTDPLTKVSSAQYDNAGRMLSKTDRKNNTISYTYAANSKLAQVTYPDSTSVILTYNNLNQLSSMQDSMGTTTYNSYDAAGRLTSMTDPNGFTISYTYDALGNVHTITYPGNKTVTYTYDNLNRLKTVTNWLGQTATYADYDAAGRLPGFTNFNGTVTSYSYDNANRLTSINNQAGANVISSYAFTLDNDGNRTNNLQTEPYSAVIDNGGTVAYTYNTQKNRLASAGSNAFLYDDEGQIATDSGNSYTFDYEHRLKTIGGSTNQFFYDGGGKRLKVIRSGVETHYVYSPSGTLLAEADSNNNITKYYIYGNGLLATITPAGQTYCYHFNGVGSTIAVTDSTQAVVNKYSYDAFGNIANQQEAIAQPFKYVGQFGVMTEPNGFYYMRARYYNPVIGRFISEDPIGFSGGDVNLMAYVGNNPVNGIDPDGLDVTLMNDDFMTEVFGPPSPNLPLYSITDTTYGNSSTISYSYTFYNTPVNDFTTVTVSYSYTPPPLISQGLIENPIFQFGKDIYSTWIGKTIIDNLIEYGFDMSPVVSQLYEHVIDPDKAYAPTLYEQDRKNIVWPGHQTPLN